MFDFSHARSFVVLAEELDFGLAAARLDVGLSPLSRQIKSLEKALGAKLIECATRPIRLTPAGRTFLVEAYRILSSTEGAIKIVRQATEGKRGVVRLGFTSTSTYCLLPHIVAHVRATLPDIDLIMEELVSEEQLRALDEHQIDLALIRPYHEILQGEKSVATAPLLRERLILAVPLVHPLVTVHPLNIQSLYNQAFISWCPSGGRYFVDLLDNLFEAVQIQPRVVQRVSSAYAMLSLVATGIGIALLPEGVRSIRMAGVKFLQIQLPKNAQPEFFLAWRRSNENSCLSSVRREIIYAKSTLETRINLSKKFNND